MERRTLIAATATLAVLTGASCCAGCAAASPGSATAASRTAAAAASCGTTAAGPCPADAANVAVAASPVVVTAPPGRAARRAPGTSAAAPSAAATASSAHPAGGSASASSAAPGSAATGPAASARPAATSAASAASDQGAAAAAAVLDVINQARSQSGLPALSVTSGLEASSAAHNLRMAGGCGLSHQCPGEAALGDRETAAGVGWSAAGENIGDGGPVADTAAAIASMAVNLTESMLSERPPDDGHRKNILSSSFTHIGIAVYRDSAGTVWLTQDFSN